LKRARQLGVALGHFNVSDLVALKAIAEAGREMGVPLLVGVSEGERAFIGVREVTALIEAIRGEGASAAFSPAYR